MGVDVGVESFLQATKPKVQSKPKVTIFLNFINKKFLSSWDCETIIYLFHKSQIVYLCYECAYFDFYLYIPI